MELLPGLYFTRPTWLLLIPFTLLCVMLFTKHGSRGTQLKKFIDPKLLPFLTKPSIGKNTSKWLGLLSLCLAIIGLSGISWEKQPQPTYTSDAKTILLIDQSISLYATDIKPNRLTRLKQKLQDIINTITEGEIAMVAFAGDAYTISPFSADKSTLTHFLLALDPLIMPLYGSNLLSGVQTSLSLLENNQSPAHLIIVTDSINSNEIIEIPKLIKLNSLQVSIIGVGSQQGGEIVLPDGSHLRKNNKTIKPTLPVSSLIDLANALNGQYFDSQLTDKDIQSIINNQQTTQKTLQESNALSNIWIEKGHWLLMPFLIWLLIQFRPGAYLLLILSLSSYPPNSIASPLEWFMTQDQLAQSKVDNGQWDEASSLFENKKWKAASNYAVERYSEAADVLKSQASSASDFYNLGNSLALSGNLEDAIQAFKKSLELDPNSKAAQENLAYLQQKQKEQNQEQDQQNQKKQKPNNDPQQSKETNNTENQQKKSQSKDDANDEEKEEDKPSDEQNNTPDDEKNAINNTKPEKNDITNEEKIALDQWLRQIQDDPGGLLKRKLWYLHQEKRAENRFKQEDGLPIW